MSVSDAPASARERLLGAALLRFDREGALGATLEEIRADAGVSVGALYHHFADKRALAGSLYLRTLEGFQESFRALLDRHPDAEEGVRGAVGYLIDWCTEHPAEARLLFHGRGAADRARLQELNRDFFEHTTRWYSTHVHYGVLRPLPSGLLAALWLGPAFEYLRQPDQKIDQVTRQELTDAAWRNLAKEPK
ncbi:MAG TPA: TetR/AcrR family transcriptional regulator [Solirubrobacteraceae bacterium]